MTRMPTAQVMVSEGTHDDGHPVLSIGAGAIDRIERTIKVNQDDGLQVWLRSVASTTDSTKACASSTSSQRSDDPMTDLVQIEYDKFKRSADWELANIRKALNMLPFLNGPAEDARLAAVKRIQSERRKRRA